MYVSAYYLVSSDGVFYTYLQQYCQLFRTPKNRHYCDAQSIKDKLYTKKIMNKNL
jgi:hypothetical protein